MPVIDIDGEAARDAARHELAKPIYPKPSPSERFFDWIATVVRHLLIEGATVPGGWLTISALLIVAAALATIAIGVARRMLRTGHVTDHPVFETGALSAAEHRAIAHACAARGDWAAAIRQRLRAITRALEETGVLHAAAGRTANELATGAGAALPRLAAELIRAADTFNEVSYGEFPGTEAGYRLVADLDDRLRAELPATAGAGTR